ncbi:hypothetical protein CAI21_11850 [Alkalilimnicola ehrlichii]|nr:Mur ligase family protein [Alkalilimnicola ehrlichii]RFA28554.1 hypothetical protein CAI21_11850 [Alkalilimnicola ehrlichii]
MSSRKNNRTANKRQHTLSGRGASSAAVAKAAAEQSASIESLLQQAMHAHEQGQVVQAMAACQKALALQPDHDGALHLTGLMAVSTGNLEIAENMLTRAANVEPHNADYRNSLGFVQYRRGKLRDAAASFNAALRIDPSHRDAQDNFKAISQALEESGQAGDAIAPADDQTLADVERLIAAGDFKQAAETCAAFAKQVPDGDARPLYLLALLNRHVGDLRKGITFIERALDRDPAQGKWWALYADLLEVRGQSIEAENARQQAKALGVTTAERVSGANARKPTQQSAPANTGAPTAAPVPVAKNIDPVPMTSGAAGKNRIKTTFKALKNTLVTEGCRLGLAEPTFTVDIYLRKAPEDVAAFNRRMRAKADNFFPEGPLAGLHEGAWPSAYLIQEEEEISFDGKPLAEVGAWVVALSIAAQRLIGDAVWKGRVLAADDERVTIAIPWQRRKAASEALQHAVQCIQEWTREAKQKRDEALAAIYEWHEGYRAGGLEPMNSYLALAAKRRGIPVRSLGQQFVFMGWGVNGRRMNLSISENTSWVSLIAARNKYYASVLLERGGVPVPPAKLVNTLSAARAAAAEFGWPVVVKPAGEDQGVDVVPGIIDSTMLREAFEKAIRNTKGAVLVEKHVRGDDHRLLVVNGKMIAAARREPAAVVGDGERTVVELVEATNADPRRGTSKSSLLMQFELDAEALALLEDQGLSKDSVLAAGQTVALRRTPNISTGGTAVDVTDEVHPDNAYLAVRAANILGLEIAGVDLLCPDISRSWRETGGYICELNGGPGLRPHWLGAPQRELCGEIIDNLYPQHHWRIPTAAITGTNGKSTVCRMLHWIWMTAGKTTGVATTNGVWIDDFLVDDRNLSGNPGGVRILTDRTVETAVIEMPRKGLIYLGHPCDRYDVAALLNVRDDHIGVDGIHSLEEMAWLKAEVLEHATDAVVVNADDPLCMKMLQRSGAKRHLLVAESLDSPPMQAHLRDGGAGAYIGERDRTRWLVLAEGANEHYLVPLDAIPATMNGLLRFNEANALFAAALAWAQGVPLATIEQALRSFVSTPERNPGRYNFIDGFPFQVVLDYGHNPDAAKELCRVVRQLPVSGKLHLVSLKLGLRHKAHIGEIVPVLADTFDTFTLSCSPEVVEDSPEYAGRDPLRNMLGYFESCLIEAGVDPSIIETHIDQQQAIREGLAKGRPGDLVLVLSEPDVALPIINAEKERFMAGS